MRDCDQCAVIRGSVIDEGEGDERGCKGGNGGESCRPELATRDPEGTEGGEKNAVRSARRPDQEAFWKVETMQGKALDGAPQLDVVLLEEVAVTVNCDVAESAGYRLMSKSPEDGARSGPIELHAVDLGQELVNSPSRLLPPTNHLAMICPLFVR